MKEIICLFFGHKRTLPNGLHLFTVGYECSGEGRIINDPYIGNTPTYTFICERCGELRYIFERNPYIG